MQKLRLEKKLRQTKRFSLYFSLIIGIFHVMKLITSKTNPNNNKVAIKVIKKDLFDQKMLERVEREIQFLTMMDHPHIVKVFF